MTIKYAVIGIISVIFLGSSQIAATTAQASTGFTGEGFKASHSARPPINPDFDPDYSCLFDVYQVQCIPGSEQECPRPQFGNNDDSTCFPKTLVNGEWKWKCPDDYHTVDDDETGQCYPNEDGCGYDDYALLTDRPGKSDRCADLRYICNDGEGKDIEACIEMREELNSDDDTNNDVPPDGVGYFCDQPYSGGCYDRNDNAGDFCLRYPEYDKYCSLIDICEWKVGDDVAERQREICN